MTKEASIIANQITDARSPVAEVDLPCGYLHEEQLHQRVMIREIGGHEEDMLGSQQIKPSAKLTELLARCVTKIGDVEDRGFIARAARKMTMGDRSWLVLKIRALTLGNVYPYTDQCPNANCGEKALFQVDLGELKFIPMPDPKRRLYEMKLPSGLAIRFHVMTGEDEESIAKFQGDQLSRVMLARVEALDGREPSLSSIKGLSMRDREAFRAYVDEVEGGVDTEIEMTCSACGTEFSRELDIGQQGFFFPSRTQSRSKRKSSS